MGNTRNTTEYSRIGKGTEDFSRLKNVIDNIKNAEKVELTNEETIEINYVTTNRNREMHRMIYQVDPSDLTDSQKARIFARIE